MLNVDLFRDYENSKLHSVEEYRALHPGSTYRYDRLDRQPIDGIPICVTRNGKNLDVTFIPDTHLLAIGATRSGKTTGYVVPTLNVLRSKQNKPSLVISDPKHELYRSNAAKFEEAGYRVILLDFTNYRHSDCWNPLTKYYRLLQQYLNAGDAVEVVDTPKGPRNRLLGRIYNDQQELDMDLSEARDRFYDEVEKGITGLAGAILPTVNQKDPFWDDSARDLLTAILYGMLEDAEEGKITEDTFSFDTVLRIFDSFTDSRSNYDGGYFTTRNPETSRAYRLARKCIIEQADTTRRCISSEFASKMNRFRDTAVRRITCTNTFEMSELDDSDRPTVIFVAYKDEESLHYEVISMFLSNLYSELISVARSKSGRLDRPFYFLLDEFGNLPRFKDFDKVISACGGRNIWFLLILQSYAQLKNVYGAETAEIIKDNLNTHVFFGTNNPETKRAFSLECGSKTIISPTSALNGSGDAIDRYEKDTVPLIPVSSLNHIAPGDCIVTQMREDVLSSHIERCYLCPEFSGSESDPAERPVKVRFSDSKYTYKVPIRKQKTA